MYITSSSMYVSEKHLTFCDMVIIKDPDRSLIYEVGPHLKMHVLTMENIL